MTQFCGQFDSDRSVVGPMDFAPIAASILAQSNFVKSLVIPRTKPFEKFSKQYTEGISIKGYNRFKDYLMIRVPENVQQTKTRQ